VVGPAGGEGQTAARLAAQAAVGALSSICPCDDVVAVATALDLASPSISKVLLAFLPPSVRSHQLIVWPSFLPLCAHTSSLLAFFPPSVRSHQLQQ
jgi:hypothetical protein